MYCQRIAMTTTYMPNTSEFNTRNLVVKVCAIFAIGIFAQLALFHLTLQPVHLAISHRTRPIRNKPAAPIGLPSVHQLNMHANVQRSANTNRGTNIKLIARSVSRSNIAPTANPKTCSCRLNNAPHSKCFYFESNNSVKCKFRACKAGYVCDASAKNAVTCVRRKRVSGVALGSGSMDECYNKTISEYVHVPHSS